MSDRIEIPLRDLVEVVVDNRGKTPPISEAGHELLEVNAISQDRRTPDYSKVRKFVSEETYRNWFRKGHPQPGDILVPTVGTIGNVALVRENRGAIAQNLIALRLKENVDSGYVYYFLSSSLGKDLMLSLDIGGVQPSIKVPHLLDLEIPITDYEEQMTVAAILSSLDDKIDLLRRQNKTLEALAETLFRQWFVEEAQDDWKKVKITDLFEVRDGTHDSPKQTVIGRPLITSKHILDGRLDIGNAYLISEDDFNKVNQRSKVDTWDILFSMIGTIGLLYLEKSPDINYVIKNIGLFKTSQNPDWAIYTYLWLRSPIGRQFIDEHTSGSTQEYVALSSLRGITFQELPKETLNKFNKLVSGTFSKIYLNRNQVQTLEKLRDTLLPKLMSGEVRVSHA